MLKEIQLRLPESTYHSEEAKLIRKAAADAIDSVNARIAEYRESADQLLQADLSTLDPEAVFDGQCRLVLFCILQDELKARKLANEFYTLHRVESQKALVKAAGISCPELVEASDNIACNCWSQNRNRMTHLGTKLLDIVRKQLAI